MTGLSDSENPMRSIRSIRYYLLGSIGDLKRQLEKVGNFVEENDKNRVSKWREVEGQVLSSLEQLESFDFEFLRNYEELIYKYTNTKIN